ncbi:MAG: HlyD family secretion protein [Rhodospirillaceae bacterium]|nr:HlyD family secretion protein [Rhodospirillaceae bacterium]
MPDRSGTTSIMPLLTWLAIPLRAAFDWGRRHLKIAAAAVVAVVAVGAAFSFWGGQDAPVYRMAKVERGPMTSVVAATGTLGATVTVNVGSQVSGQVRDLLVDFNSVVRRNQVIAVIDTEMFEARVNQATADLDVARAVVNTQKAQVEKASADLENARATLNAFRSQTARNELAAGEAERDYTRRRPLRDRGVISDAEFDKSKAAFDSAQAQLRATRSQEEAQAAALKSSEAQLKIAIAQLGNTEASVRLKQALLRQAEIDLDHTTIRAPVDGVVISRDVDVGATVATSLQSPTLFTIAQDLTRMQVEAKVDEADVSRIFPGQRVDFTVDAFPSRSFNGEVVQIRKAPKISQGVVTYVVVVSTANPDQRLMPGMTANVRFIVEHRESAMKVASAALRFRPTPVSSPAPRPDPLPQPGAGLGPGGGHGVGGGFAVGAGPAPRAPGGGGGGPGGGGQARNPRVQQGGAQAAGVPAPELTRERLTTALTLDETQQTKIQGILDETRQKLAVLTRGQLGQDERRAENQRIRMGTVEAIAAVLSPDQQGAFRRLLAGDSSAPVTTPGRMWVKGPGGELVQVMVRVGITDSGFTEIVEGDLRDGQEVVVGIVERRTSMQEGPRPPRLGL